MKYFLITLTVIAYILASIAWFIWIWDNIKGLSTDGICGSLSFIIIVYVVITMFISIAFENIFDIDLGW